VHFIESERLFALCEPRLSGVVVTVLLQAPPAKPANRLSSVPSGKSSSLLNWSDLNLVVVLSVLLAVGTAALYAPALKNGFVNFDDPDYVTRNAHVQLGLSWSNFFWTFNTNNEAANWHPLTWISHMLDVQFYGLQPAGHHFTNVLLQVFDVVLVFLFFRRATGHTLRSAAVAAIFAIHPLNVESVAWIAERKAVLCMFFMLLALLAYVWYAQKPGVGRYLSVMLLFALGLLAKIMVVAFPIALLLLDYWPLHRLPEPKAQGDAPSFSATFRRLTVEKIPFFVLAAAAGGMTLLVHHKEGALAATLPLSWRFRNVIYSYLAYIGKLIWPVHLAVFYPHPENSLSWRTVILAAIFLAAISAVIWHFRERRYLLMGWLWYLATMFPMVGLIQSGRQGMADRYMYIPMLGIFVAVVWLFSDWAAKLKLSRGIVTACFLLALVPYVYLTRTQISYWRDSYTLFSHTLEVTGNNGIAENNLGAALMEMGEPQRAAPHFEAAARFIPMLASAHYNLGLILQGQNRLQEAAQQYAQTIAVATDPLELAQAHNNLGIVYMTANNYPAATMELSKAIALNPMEQNSYIGRGMIEAQSWNFDAAIADFSSAARIAPTPIGYFWLGRAYEGKGDRQRAANAYMLALKLAPNMADARTRLDALRESSGQ
jgi:protein O-mannosyl-transferase